MIKYYTVLYDTHNPIISIVEHKSEQKMRQEIENYKKDHLHKENIIVDNEDGFSYEDEYGVITTIVTHIQPMPIYENNPND